MANISFANTQFFFRKLPENSSNTAEIVILVSMQEMNMHNLPLLLFHIQTFEQIYQILIIWYVLLSLL